MASVSHDPNGLKRIQWIAGDGKRKTLRLGHVTAKQADAIKIRIEQLLASQATGVMDTEAARWVASLDDTMHGRIAALGLVPPRQTLNATLGTLLDAYFDTLNVKPQTKVTYAQTRASLSEWFGESRPLTAITPLDAERWRQSMIAGGLALATVSKRVKTARQIFKQSVRWKMLAENPLQDVKAGAQKNRARLRFIPMQQILRVIHACPDAEWRLIVALSRIGGLRCPSEHLSLRPQDIDWGRGRFHVTSPKTEGQDKGSRWVPLFPELVPFLRDALASAPAGSTFVISRYRQRNCNLRTQLLRIIRRAGLEPWPRLFHNLRASRQTELCERFPAHVVCEWLGNTEAVAAGHYLQVMDAHFGRAIAEITATPVTEHAAQKAAHFEAQHAAAPPGTDSHESGQNGQTTPAEPSVASPCEALFEGRMTPRGFEPRFPG